MAFRSELTDAAVLQHAHERLLVEERRLLAPQAQSGHEAQILWLSGASSAHIKYTRPRQPLLDLHYSLQWSFEPQHLQKVLLHLAGPAIWTSQLTSCWQSPMALHNV